MYYITFEHIINTEGVIVCPRKQIAGKSGKLFGPTKMKIPKLCITVRTKGNP